MLEEYINLIKNKYPKNSKIVIAMSGGLDSSVTAALIKRAGFETIGITLQLYRSKDIAKEKTCCAGKDIKDAQNVAYNEGFQHYVLDYTTYFKDNVIDDFVDSYEKGETPIPCGRCNQYIKFGYLLDFCKKIEADLLVTGHYALKKNNKLYKSLDKKKDQTYFLALTTPEQIKYIDFPLATIEKNTVRKLAEELNLKVANKQESMDICFIPDGNYKNFLFKLRPEMFKNGDIIDTKNNILGTHNGLANYTIGQRKGIKLSNGPWYVKKLNIETNQLVVGKFEELSTLKCTLEEVVLHENNEYFKNKELLIKTRSTSIETPGEFNPLNNEITFYTNQPTVCKGQICAFYNKNQLIGGGIIKSN